MTNGTMPPAGWYTDGQAPGHERWWDGTQWTDVLRHEPQSQPARVPQRGSAPTCPSCGSDEVKSYRAIREQGTTTGTGHSVGWVQGTGSQPGHMASFTTRTTSYTTAALRAAPPVKRQNGLVLVVTGVIFAGLSLYLGYVIGTASDVAAWMVILTVVFAVAGFGMLIGGVILTPADLAYNRDVYPDDYNRWSRSWRCLRCGSGFAV